MSQLSKNIVSYSGAILLQKVVSFFYFTIIARTLGPGLAGTFFLGFSLTQLFAAFVDLGFGNYLIREVAQNRERSKDLFQYIWGAKTILSLMGFVGVVVSAWILGYQSVVIAISVVAGVALVIDSLSAINYSALRGHQVLQAESLGIVSYQIVLAVLGTTLLMTTHNIVLLALASVAASIVHFAISRHYVQCRTDYVIRPRYRLKELLLVVKHSLPFAFIMVFGRLYTQTDIIMLSKIGCGVRDCIHDIGLYTTAVKATLVIQSIPLSFMASIYPALSEAYSSNHERFRQLFLNTTRFMIVGIVGVVGVFWVFGNQAVTFVWGSDFVGSVRSLVLLLFGSIFVVASYPCAAALNSAHFQKSYATYTLYGLIVNVIANAVLIPNYGIQGAAIASAIGSFVLVVCSWMKMNSIARGVVTQGLNVLMRVVISGVAAFMIVRYGFGSLHFMLGSVFQLCVFVGILFVVRIIDVGEAKRILVSLRGPKASTNISETPFDQEDRL